MGAAEDFKIRQTRQIKFKLGKFRCVKLSKTYSCINLEICAEESSDLSKNLKNFA